MARTWGLSIDEKERLDLERVVMDEDEAGALEFLKSAIYPKVKESEKPGSCFHDVNKTVDELPRSVSRHKKIGSFD